MSGLLTLDLIEKLREIVPVIGPDEKIAQSVDLWAEDLHGVPVVVPVLPLDAGLLELEYVDHIPQYKVSFRTDEALFNFFGEWKCLVSENVLTDTTLENWKIDPFPFSEWERFSRFLELGKVSGRQMVTTARLLEGGFDFSYIYLDALARGCCTEEEMLAILKLFDEDPIFKDSQNAIDCLTAIFADGLIPDSCLDKAFHEVDQYGASLIQKGAVRHAYETSQKLSPEEQEQYRNTLRASLKEYHDSELRTL